MNPPPLPFLLLIFTRSPNARHREQSVFFSMKGILFFFFFKQVRLLLLSRIIGFFEKDSQRTEISFATRVVGSILAKEGDFSPVVGGEAEERSEI